MRVLAALLALAAPAAAHEASAPPAARPDVVGRAGSDLAPLVERMPQVAMPPPLTAAEMQAFRDAVVPCWAVPDGAGAVRMAFELNRDGTPVPGSILPVDGDPDDAEAARRAIIRCGAEGYPLPPEKYRLWKEVEMTFDPEATDR